MGYSIRQGAIIGAALIVVACVAGLLATLPPLWPVKVSQAHQRWQGQHIQHYRVDVVWADGWSVGHAQVEMRNGKLVAATDLDSGRPLDPRKYLTASYFASIDTLFEILEQRVWQSINWRIVLSRYHPLIARWLKPCLAPLSSVTFDTQLGYPQEISYNNGWCDQTTFFSYSQVQLSNLRPLP